MFYRYQLTKDGQIVEFMGGLSLDLMDDFQNRFLINGVQLGIRLWPYKKEFCLLSAEENADYKVNIVDAKLKLKHVKLTPGAFIGHQKLSQNMMLVIRFIDLILKRLVYQLDNILLVRMIYM